jgi:uncharacterized membrane protein YbhN (UPF0104 family)
VRKALVEILKVGIPLGIGVWLVFSTFNELSPAQQEELFAAFGQAHMGWLLLATLVGWLAHVSRGWRWRYLLAPLGHRPGFWNCYHAVMIGYFMNMFIPRAGEASRAVSLSRTDKVPFEQGFGTILAERVVDTTMLACFGLAAVLFQLDKLDLFQARIEAYRATQATTTAGDFPWGAVLLTLVGLVVVAGAYLMITRPAVRDRANALLRGFTDGLRAVLRMDRKGAFIAHTVFIWAAYFAMFAFGFHCLPGMDQVPLAGILAGFIAGALGIVLVQGGIGVYPAFVALIVGVYMAPPEGGGLLRPDALAMGWLMWAVQTLMLIVLGGLSLLLTTRRKAVAP